MRPVVILGVGMHPFGRYPALRLRDLVRVACWDACKDAGIRPDGIQIAYFGNSIAGILTGQEGIRGQIGLREVGIARIPVINVENACASGATAFREAWMAVASGLYEIALAVGAEKMFCGDTQRTLAALETSADVEVMGGRGLQFSALNAMRLKLKMAMYGWTVDHFARVAAKNHRNGSLNPYAHHRIPYTAADVLASRPIADPITLLMCSSISDGAAAVILACSDVGRKRGVQPLISVAGSGLRSGNFTDGTTDGRSAVEMAASEAYEMAGIGPEDVDVADVHDAVAPAELIRCEELGLCSPGDAVRLLEQGETEINGRIPINPSGGLTARGHPIGATGIAQIIEITWQLRGQAGERQVKRRTRVGLAQNSGGHVEGDNAIVGVHILKR